MGTICSARYLSVLHPKQFMDASVMVVNLFTVATPLSVAAIFPSNRLSMAQFFSIQKKLTKVTHVPPESCPCSKDNGLLYGTSQLARK